jgi:hypothetical protein
MTTRAAPHRGASAKSIHNVTRGCTSPAEIAVPTLPGMKSDVMGSPPK